MGRHLVYVVMEELQRVSSIDGAELEEAVVAVFRSEWPGFARVMTRHALHKKELKDGRTFSKWQERHEAVIQKQVAVLHRMIVDEQASSLPASERLAAVRAALMAHGSETVRVCGARKEIEDAVQFAEKCGDNTVDSEGERLLYWTMLGRE